MLAETHMPDLSPDQEFGAGSDEIFKAALQVTPVAILMTDPYRAGNPIVFANDAFTRLTGYSPDETLGRSYGFLQGAGTDRATVAAVEDALRSGRGIETEILSYRKDGSSFWNALTVRPVHDQQGRLRSFIASQSDVSARRQDETARRTRNLQAALEQKTAMLHEAEHRAKNTLQMIASLVLLKGRRIRAPEASKALHDLAERVGALSTAQRLLSTGDDISRFSLSDFTVELAGELTSALPGGQVTVRLDIEPLRVPAARAASFALLLNEVIGNAVKHAFPQGRQGRLTIRIGHDEKDLMIAVEDDGVGLRHSPAPEGSFGKTLITMLVQQLKGRLTWLDAEPGTRVEIVIPADSEEARLEHR